MGQLNNRPRHKAFKTVIHGLVSSLEFSYCFQVQFKYFNFISCTIKSNFSSGHHESNQLSINFIKSIYPLGVKVHQTSPCEADSSLNGMPDVVVNKRTLHSRSCRNEKENICPPCYRCKNRTRSTRQTGRRS